MLLGNKEKLLSEEKSSPMSEPDQQMLKILSDFIKEKQKKLGCWACLFGSSYLSDTHQIRAAELLSDYLKQPTKDNAEKIFESSKYHEIKPEAELLKQYQEINPEGCQTLQSQLDKLTKEYSERLDRISYSDDRDPGYDPEDTQERNRVRAMRE